MMDEIRGKELNFNTMLVSCRGNTGKLYSCNVAQYSTYCGGLSEISTYEVEIMSEDGTIHKMQCVIPSEIEVVGGDAIAD